MKKLTRIILIFVIAIACSLALPNKVMAAEGDTPGTAIDIPLNQIRTVRFDSRTEPVTKWFKFTVPDDRYGTFKVEVLNPTSHIRIYVYDTPYQGDDHHIEWGFTWDYECKAYPECDFERTYLIKVYDFSGNNHDLDVTVRNHQHNWQYDYFGNMTGTKYYYCLECSKWVDCFLEKTSYTYDGKHHFPELIFDTAVILYSWDHEFTYPEECKDVGRYTVRADVYLPGEEEYSYLYRTFRINPKGTYITRLNRATRGFTVRWARQSEKMSKSRITGYKIRYSRNSSMSNAKTITVKGYKNTSRKITKLAKNRNYYVQVRTYKVVNGSTFYSPWSVKKSVKTR